MSDHHPPHIFLDNSWYMLTAGTYGHRPFLASDEAKALVRDLLCNLIAQLDIRLLAWTILDNHYHTLLRARHGEDISRLVSRLHGASSRGINRRDRVVGRQIWHNYWETALRTETDLWTRFNYVHQNAVKHGYVRAPEEWPFSSYRYYQRTRGEEWVSDVWARYSVVDFLERDDLSGLQRGERTHGPDAG